MRCAKCVQPLIPAEVTAYEDWRHGHLCENCWVGTMRLKAKRTDRCDVETKKRVNPVVEDRIEELARRLEARLPLFT